MALAAAHTFTAGETLTAARLNEVNTNILNNGLALISPLTDSLSLGNWDLESLDELALSDAAAAPQVNRLRRNGAVLQYGSANNGGLKCGSVSGTPETNTLYQQSLIKGWAVILGGTVPTLVDSYNVTSVTVTPGEGFYTITWDRDFSPGAYTVFGTMQSATAVRVAVQVTALSGGSCTVALDEIGLGDEVGGTVLGTSERLHILAAGDQ